MRRGDVLTRERVDQRGRLTATATKEPSPHMDPSPGLASHSLPLLSATKKLWTQPPTTATLYLIPRRPIFSDNHKRSNTTQLY